MIRFLIVAFLLAAPAIASAQDLDPPVRYTWIATSCETWNCAAAALVLADGDKHVIVLPTGREERPWIILRRVEAGSVHIPDEEPFRCEVFADLDGATSHFRTMEACRSGLALTVPDGRAVVAALSSCTKRRAVR